MLHIFKMFQIIEKNKPIDIITAIGTIDTNILFLDILKNDIFNVYNPYPVADSTTVRFEHDIFITYPMLITIDINEIFEN